MILVPLFDLKFLDKVWGGRSRNFKSAALAEMERLPIRCSQSKQYETGGLRMPHGAKWRSPGRSAGAVLALLTGALLATTASAQTGEPIKIGYSMAHDRAGSGPTASRRCSRRRSGRRTPTPRADCSAARSSSIYYDDQTNPATVPGIYTKLLDVDKVDLDHRRLRHQHAGAGDAGRRCSGRRCSSGCSGSP